MSETPRDQRDLWHEVSRTFEELGEALRVHLSADAARTPTDPTAGGAESAPWADPAESPGRPGEGAGAAGSEWIGAAGSAPWADPARPGESHGFEDPWAAATDTPPRVGTPGPGAGATSADGAPATDAGATDPPPTEPAGAAGPTGAGTGGTGASGTGAGAPGATGASATGTGATGTGATGTGAAGAGTPGAGTAGAGTPGAGTAGAGTPGAGTAGAGTAGAGTAGAGAAGAAGAGGAGAGGPGAGGAGAGAAGAGGAGAGGAGAGGARERGWREWRGTSGGGRFASPADWDSARESVLDLGNSVRRIATQAGDAARDPHVRDSAQRAARSLGDAIVTTVEDIAAELRDRMRNPRWSDTSRPPEPPPVAPIEDNRDDKP